MLSPFLNTHYRPERWFSSSSQWMCVASLRVRVKDAYMGSSTLFFFFFLLLDVCLTVLPGKKAEHFLVSLCLHWQLGTPASHSYPDRVCNWSGVKGPEGPQLTLRVEWQWIFEFLGVSMVLGTSVRWIDKWTVDWKNTISHGNKV